MNWNTPILIENQTRSLNTGTMIILSLEEITTAIKEVQQESLDVIIAGAGIEPEYRCL